MMIPNSTVASLMNGTHNDNGNWPNGFDPFADLLSAQASRPLELRPVNLRTLTPFQRALVSIDGTVTKFIEAYTLESKIAVRSFGMDGKR